MVLLSALPLEAVLPPSEALVLLERSEVVALPVDELRTLTIAARTADRLSRPVSALFFTVRTVVFCFVVIVYLPARVSFSLY